DTTVAACAAQRGAAMDAIRQRKRATSSLRAWPGGADSIPQETQWAAREKSPAPPGHARRLADTVISGKSRRAEMINRRAAASAAAHWLERKELALRRRRLPRDASQTA